jgi:hypothetical protein
MATAALLWPGHCEPADQHNRVRWTAQLWTWWLTWLLLPRLHVLNSRLCGSDTGVQWVVNERSTAKAASRWLQAANGVVKTHTIHRLAQQSRGIIIGARVAFVGVTVSTRHQTVARPAPPRWLPLG